jgi:Protein of unknown function DUF262/Protein of unknown function (DUF1524)
MPIRETLTAKPVALAEVLSNGKRYIVPPFQRDYAWDSDEWAELWADILEVHKETPETSHYLGALVLQPTGERSDSKVIDGQQRLVTLSLLALAVIGRIQRLADRGQDADNNLERVRLLREKFVSTKDSASLQHRSRLKLNDQDNPFFQTHLLQGISPSRPSALRGSEARLHRAFLFFDAAVGDLFGEGATGAELAGFLETSVALRLRFIEILVEDDETAFTVFETLNSRGVALGTADLLKNFVFSTAAKGGQDDLEQARIWWEQIIRLVPLEQLATFLFHKLSGRTPDMREKRVFSEVKHIVGRQRTVFELLRETKEAAEIYAALDDPRGDFWADFPESRRPVQVLELLRVEPSRSVILAALPRLADKPDRLARFLGNLVVVSLRASVAKVSTGELQRVYQAAAYRIEQGDLKSPLAIAKALGAVMPTDEDFQAAFSQLVLDPRGSRKQLVRYLLSELEAASGGQRIDFEATDATVEHILPENAAGGWEGFSSEDRRRDIYRLGNLTPLEWKLNKGLGSSDFARKREVYAKSRFHLTQSISHHDWSPASIRARQLQMAERAVAIWRIEDIEA